MLRDGRSVPIRVSIVEWPTGAIVYDHWLIPPGGVDAVDDWLTHVSGASRETTLAKADHTSEQMVEELKGIIGPETIILAHAGVNDFKLIGLKPPRNVLDTAIVFEHPELIHDPTSLAMLVERYMPSGLDRRTGHSSVDDA